MKHLPLACLLIVASLCGCEKKTSQTSKLSAGATFENDLKIQEHLSTGKAAFLKGKLNEAKEVYFDGLKISPAKSDLHALLFMNLGTIYHNEAMHKKHDFAHALHLYNRALSLPGVSPDLLAEIHYKMGMTRHITGNMEGARMNFETALNLTKNKSLTNKINLKIEQLLK